MNDEKDFMIKWASENCSDAVKHSVLTERDRNMDSYFTKRDNEHCIEEYEYRTVPEMREKRNREYRKEYLKVIDNVLVAATFKEKSKHVEHIKRSERKDKELPDYVYTF